MTDTAELTGFPAILGHRVVTLHPKVHGGILADRDDPEHHSRPRAVRHRPDRSRRRQPLSVLVRTRSSAEADRHRRSRDDPRRGEEPRARRRRDRPGRLRRSCSTSCAPRASRCGDEATARAQGVRAHGRVRRRHRRVVRRRRAAARLARARPTSGCRSSCATARTRINRAALYRRQGATPWWDGMTQHSGIALSYLNLYDADAAWLLVHDMDPSGGPACAIIKHANPCGAAIAATLAEAYQLAFECDERSAFGGIVAVNRPDRRRNRRADGRGRAGRRRDRARVRARRRRPARSRSARTPASSRRRRRRRTVAICGPITGGLLRAGAASLRRAALDVDGRHRTRSRPSPSSTMPSSRSASAAT